MPFPSYHAYTRELHDKLEFAAAHQSSPPIKVVINSDFGGFSIKEEVATLLGVDSYRSISRTDPRLVAMVERGEDVGGECATLTVVEVPAYLSWYIDEYDGLETICY